MFFKKLLGSKKIFLILAIIFLNLLIISPALAAAGDYTPLVAIPGINANAGLMVYLNGVYTFLISIVGILAMAVLVYGGMRYVTSAGNQASIGEAKESINAALIGLLLALVSWVIFATINKDILVLKPVGVGLPSGKYGDGLGGIINCALPTGNGTAASPCHCIDDPVKEIFANPNLPPYIASISIAPCSANVPISTSSLIITFSEPMMSSTIIDTNFVSMGGNFLYTLTYNASNYQAILTLTQPLTNPGSYEIGIRKDIKSNKGINLLNDFILKFTTGNTPPSNCASFSVGAGCSRICSDPTFAIDGRYHCMKAGVKVGWVGDRSDYTDEQLRAMATGTGTADAPYIAYEGGIYIIDVERNSIVLNTPVEYRVDLDGDMNCDTVLNGSGGGWFLSQAGYSGVATKACKPTANPKSETCSQKFCIKDSQNNEASVLLYSTVLAK